MPLDGTVLGRGTLCARGEAVTTATTGSRIRGSGMTNTTALVLGLLLLGFIGYDMIANGGSALLFLGKKLFEFIEWLAFWR